ncbi:putative Extracellular serine proteinase [Nannochloris sp. 'desiccata']|nr:putative Extracellular serine proteinase [Chlorella desiccata (nom. nud.)]
MCHPNSLIFRIRAAPLGLPGYCHMPNICHRIYSTAVFGFAGNVTTDELEKVNRCLPRAVWYRELDGTVYKAEDPSLQRRVDSNVGGDGGPFNNGDSNQRRDLLQHEIPRIQSYSDFNASRSTEGPPIDLTNITGISGVTSFSSPGSKTQSLGPVLWNLDRIDQRDLPLDNLYRYGTPETPGTGTGVTIYTIDSGIIKSHQEFQKAGNPSESRASYGYNFVDDTEDARDCDGHGTHVSATAAGLQVGVAKNANIVSIKILDCNGSGTISDTVAALDWVAANAKKPAVATLSLGIQVGSWSRVLEDAVRSLVNNHGVTVIVASGNSAVDSCYVAPANVPEVITVSATDVKNKYNGTFKGGSEGMYEWSNTGPCVDIHAPGVDIYSACGSQSRCDEVTNDAYTYASGTSMAVPSVAGVAALYLEANPKATPNDVAAAVIGGATQNVVDESIFKPGTPNRLLYSKVAVKQVAAAQGP